MIYIYIYMLKIQKKKKKKERKKGKELLYVFLGIFFPKILGEAGE